MHSLHITNGDSAARILAESAIDGDILAWRDPMHHGPFPKGLSWAELAECRAEYLAGPTLDADVIALDFSNRDRRIQNASDYDHVTLWFEHDVLDQLQILQILSMLAEVSLSQTDLSLICINSFPNRPNFRGLGELNPLELASLAGKAVPVSDETFACAIAGWAAFQSPEPHALLAFVQSDLPGLPFLKAALMRHFAEYPNCRTGLTQTELQMLKLVSQGVQKPVDLFRRNMDFETALFVGDLQSYAVLERLTEAGLLKNSGSEVKTMHLTETGTQVLAGQINAFDLIHRDGWIGGVALSKSGQLWVWNPETKGFSQRSMTP